MIEKPKNKDWVFAVIGNPEWDKWLLAQRTEFELSPREAFADWLWPRYVREFSRRFAVERACGALRLPAMKKDP